MNPGSVGNPIESDVAAGWCVVDGDRVELRRVTYDRETVIRQTITAEHPASDDIAAHLRGERDFTAQPISVDVHEFEPSLEAKRA